MKAVLLRGPGEVVLEEVPIPEISDEEVLVEVKYCGICGTDRHAVADCLLISAGTYMGHEFSGVIAKVGGNVKGWEVGDRVAVNPLYFCGKCYACQHGLLSQCYYGFGKREIGAAPGLEHAGGFAKFVRVPIPGKRLHHLPDGVSFEEGALVEPLACSLHAVKMSTFRVGEHVMVLGAGPLGLGVIAFLKYAGAGLIVATETIEKRVELARKLGVDYVLDPQKAFNLKEKVLELTNGEGVEVVFDCSGVPQAFQSATDFLRRGGQVLLAGISEREVPIISMNWVINEWQLQGSMSFYSDEFPIVIEFLKKGVSPIKEMITSKIKLSNIAKEGFEALTSPDNNEIKILVEPDE